MPDLALLNEELDQLMARRKALREKHRTAVLPDDARAEDESLFSRAEKVERAIEEEKQKQRDRKFDFLSDYTERPDNRPQTPINPDNETKAVLSRLGWEAKSGVLMAPTSLGKTVDLVDESVVFGPMPVGDPEATQYFKQTRAIFQPEYRGAYLKYIRAFAQGGDHSRAWSQLDGFEQKALEEGSDPAGGFLVPPDIQAEVLVRLPQLSVMRGLARIMTTSRDEVRFPAVAPHGTSGSLYSSGFVGTWAAETPAFTETDPSFQQFIISIKMAKVSTKLSNNFIADAASNVLAFLAQNGAENLALVEDQGFIAGVGAGNEPLGILNSGATGVDVESSLANNIQNTATEAAAGTGSAPKMINLVYAVPAQYSGRSSWIMRRSIEGEVRKMQDANGRPLWPEYVASGFAPAPRQLLGAPVYNSDFVPDDNTDTNKVFIYGDISQYIIAQRMQISTIVLRERFADTFQTGIILYERVGGGLWNTDAIRFGVV